MTSLAHLPEHRRETLLLRYADKLDYDGVDALVRERSQEPCRWKIGPPAITGELTAIPGDDGRYHLCADGRPRCTGNWSPQYDTSAYLHRQQCGWWTDGTSYRAQPPPGSGHEPQRQSHREISWLVFLRGEATDPGLVPPSHRCPDSLARGQWPPYQDARTALGRIRLTLTSAFGRNCQACRRRVAADVDHDPITGLVRGLLCKTCNNHVETCPHVSGCPWADYLNDPPTAPLQLRYPGTASARRGYQQKIASLGIDPYAPGRRRTP